MNPTDYQGDFVWANTDTMNTETLKQHAEVIRNAADKCGYMAIGFIVVRIIPRADEPQNPTAFECLMTLAGYEVNPFNDEYFIPVFTHVNRTP